MTSSNITEINPGQKLHIFITSLYSQNFFYHYEFFEKNPSNMQLEDKDKIAVRWWYPDILFDYHEPVTRFELFRRQMRIGYSKFGESLASAVVIVPSNFNEIEQNFDVDAIYGDKIVILTKKLAKLYYILSKIVEAKKEEFIGDRNVIIIFVQEKSFIGELYKVGNREFYLLERIEIIIPSSVNSNKDEKEEQKITKKTADAEITLYSIIAEVRERLNKNKEKFAFTVVFRANMKEKTLDSTKLEDYFFVNETKTENEILREGALFKAQTDFEGNSYTFVDNTKKLPHFNIVYPLLNDPSSYRPITEAFGIDLGTSRSALAVHRLYGTDFDLNIIHDEFEEGTLLYSWVAFDKDERQPFCGRTVYERFKTKAEYIVFDCKKIIGKRLEEIQINDEWKFKLLEDKENVKIQVKSKDKNKNKEITIFVTPEEVYAIMLERFHSNAMGTTKIPLKNAVFTIPSNFTQKQKNSMKKAAQLANIEVLRFIPEPTAAVLSYCSRMIEGPKNGDLIFVFDLGGGTFDISIFKVENSKLIELCQHSNLKLGGTVFNKILYDEVVRELKDEHDIDVGEKEHELWIKCTDAKEDLTERTSTNINIDAKDIDVNITRDEFEEMCEPLIDKIKESIDFSLNKAHIRAEEITYVIKVGGSCAMPMIKSLIRDTFPSSKLEHSDPQHEVAFGAALYASAILPQQKIKTDFIKNHWPL